MTNFILKYNENNEPDIEKMTAVLNAHGVRILDDRLLPKAALVELEESGLESFQTDLGGEWNIYPEKSYQLPGTMKKIRKKIR